MTRADRTRAARLVFDLTAAADQAHAGAEAAAALATWYGTQRRILAREAYAAGVRARLPRRIINNLLATMQEALAAEPHQGTA